jgi:two-component system invasion response regulator UvrY
MNILIIEDHPLIRMGLKQLITESDPKATVSQADNFPACISLLEHEKFDLLILDIDVPGGRA